MAIDDNKQYVFSGAQIKDIAKRVLEVTPEKKPALNVAYWANFYDTYVAEHPMGCTVQNIDAAKLDAFCKQYEVDEPYLMFMYFDSTWEFHGPKERVEIAAADFASTTGITVEVEEDWADLSIMKRTVPDKTQDPVVVEVYEYQIPHLCNVDDDTFFHNLGENKIDVLKDGVKRVEAVSWQAFDSIPSSFLCRCQNLESVSFGAKVYGDNVCAECPVLTTAPILVNAIQIGNGFCQGCASITDIPSFNSTEGEAVEIGNDFMAGCTNLQVASISFYRVRKIGNNFLQGCDNVTCSTYLESYDLVEVGNNFMSQTGFCCPLDRQGFYALERIGKSFMSGCSRLAGLNLPKVTTVGGSFLGFTRDLGNVPIRLPLATSVGDSFMEECENFAGELVLSSLKTAGYGFMNGCRAYNRKLELPDMVFMDDQMFCCNCQNLPEVSFGKKVSFSGRQATAQANCFGMGDQSAPAYVNGIRISGAGRSTVLEHFPNRSSNPFRKLVDGGE